VKKSFFVLVFLTLNAVAATDDAIQAIINHHLEKYAHTEHFSAIQVSIKAGSQRNTYVAGTRAISSAIPLTPTSLFDIGSITKSFTAALVLLAEGEGKIQVNAPLRNYLKDYPHWGDISLTELLNMSSGIPNYSNAPTINYLMSKNLRRYWSNEELIKLVYPKLSNPPRKTGYFYSNTGYVLMDMILSAQYKQSYSQLLMTKIITPLGLNNTFYPLPDYSPDVLTRLVRGYSYNIYDNPELLGQDVTENNLGWAGAAGAIVANSEDVLHWVEVLFEGNNLLTNAQKNHMQKIISTTTGKAIVTTDKDDDHGFGLGIVQGYSDKIGHYWFYEGETLGYRALYMYVPCNKVILVTLFNSATNQENDHAGELIQNLYANLLSKDNSLICKKKDHSE
jgi:D-alanyl-D-alanine carboxypeptidase